MLEAEDGQAFDDSGFTGIVSKHNQARNAQAFGDSGDRITALGGNNTIFGGAENDTIVVGLGRNLIDGGAGNDTIYLTFGQDTIALARGNGNDTVYNYEAGSTRFSLAAGLAFNDLTIAQDGGSILIREGSERLASLVGVRASSVTASSFVTA